MAKAKKKRSLIVVLSGAFTVFIIVILVITGFATYLSQMNIYKKQCETNIRNISEYLETMIQADGALFKDYQEYYIEHYAEVNIPYDFDEYVVARAKFLAEVAEKYPGKVFGEDLFFDELDDDTQKAFFIYYHEYWLLTFEQARDAFNIPYTYYLLMNDEIHDVVYMLDGERSHKEDVIGDYLYLGDHYYNDPEIYQIEWKTWETGEKQDGYQEWDNAWGHTYAYYTPLVIDGEKMGLVVSEIDVETVNKEILNNTLRQLGVVAAVLLAGVTMMIYGIRRKYIYKIEKLEDYVLEYSVEKDVEIADLIEEEAMGQDEISSLAKQFSTMIHEIENYVQNLVRTTQELKTSQQHVAEMNELANKDALTGIRNKTAYDKQVAALDEELKNGMKHFGIGMVDLNCLKIINDTYGHDKGNIAIRKLCHLVCVVFSHSPVFRIGGDEFAIILKGADYDDADNLLATFESRLKEIEEDYTLEPWEKVSAAVGIAKYDTMLDTNVSSVFKRADQAMYERKQEMKWEMKRRT